MSKTGFARLACLLALAALLSACGGGGGDSTSSITPPPPSGGNPTPPDPIEGIAMPSSVSVVTATNAS